MRRQAVKPHDNNTFIIFFSYLYYGMGGMVIAFGDGNWDFLVLAGGGFGLAGFGGGGDFPVMGF
jgi:hypothetical protein